jgi:hypothetical protein
VHHRGVLGTMKALIEKAKLLARRRVVTDEEAKEAAVPFELSFIYNDDNDDLTPQNSFMSPNLSSLAASASRPQQRSPIMSTSASHYPVDMDHNSAHSTPMRRSPMTTIRPLTILPAHMTGPSIGLSNNIGVNDNNGAGTPIGSLNIHSDPNYGNDEYLSPTELGELDIPLARQQSNGAAGSLWLPMAGRVGFLLFKLVAVGVCAITVFILLAALSGPWSSLRPYDKFTFQNTTVTSNQ